MAGSTYTVRLGQETVGHLDAMAQSTGRTRAWLMAQAIERYVEQEAWQVVEIQKAVGKFERGEARFADHEDVMEWLESLGTDQEKSRPICK